MMQLGNFSPSTQSVLECPKKYFNDFIPDIHSDLLSKTYLLNNRGSP